MNFSTEVLERSFKTPIVVDFWAEWCGPCKVLGPVIENLADEANGKWALVKLNTEQEPELSAQYNIRSIPTVKMIYKGEVLAEFMGALPKHQIQNWLAENLPDERLNEWNFIVDQGTIADLKRFVKANADLPRAAFELALRIVKTEPQTALELLKSLENNAKFYEKAKLNLAIAELLMPINFDGQNEKFSKIILAAQSAYLANDFDTCLNLLIESIMLNKAFENELARRACIAIFQNLGEEHELSKKYRRRFNMALY